MRKRTFAGIIAGFCLSWLCGAISFATVALPYNKPESYKEIPVTYTAPLVVTRNVIRKATVIVPVTIEVTREVINTVEIPVKETVIVESVPQRLVEVIPAKIVAEEVATPIPVEPTVTASQVVVMPSGPSYPCLIGQIKGNNNSKIYHIPTGGHYAQTFRNVTCFNSEDDAKNAGFRKAQN